MKLKAYKVFITIKQPSHNAIRGFSRYTITKYVGSTVEFSSSYVDAVTFCGIWIPY